MAQATLCATSRGKELRSCRKDCRWKLQARAVAVTWVSWVSSVIDESSDGCCGVDRWRVLNLKMNIQKGMWSTADR